MHRNRQAAATGPRVTGVAGLLLAAALMAGPAGTARADAGAAVPAEVGPGDRPDLASALGRDPADLAAGRLEILRLPGGSLVVLRDGTEIGRLPEARAAAYLAAHPEPARALESMPASSAAGAPGGGSRTWLATLSGGDWIRFGRWKEGLVLGYRVDYLYSDVLVRRNILSGGFLKRLGPLYAGAGAEQAAFTGDLADSVPYAKGAAAAGWHVEAGTYFLRYRLSGGRAALPEWFWSERGLEGKYFARGDGGGAKVVRILEPGSAPGLEHRLEARFGALRYAWVAAPSAYLRPLHLASLDDLPGVLGTWGMGALLTPEGFIPGAWYQVRAFTLARARLGGASLPLQGSPGRITCFRSARNHFRVAWAGELRLAW